MAGTNPLQWVFMRQFRALDKGFELGRINHLVMEVLVLAVEVLVLGVTKIS